MQVLIWILTAYLLYKIGVIIFSEKREYVVIYGLFNIWWMALILMAMPEVVNTFALSRDTMVLLCSGSVSFSLGYLFYIRRKSLIARIITDTKCYCMVKRGDNWLREKVKDYTLDIAKMFRYIQAVLLMVFVYYFFRYNALLEIHGIQMSRIIKFEVGLLFRSTIEAMLFQYVITALLYVSIYYYLTDLFQTRVVRRDIGLMAANVVVYSLIGQGRFCYFNILLLLIILVADFLSHNPYLIRDPHQIRKYLLPMAGVVLALTVCLISMTLLRMGASLSNFMDYLGRVFFQVYCYFTGGFKGLQQLLNTSLAGYDFIPGHFTFTVLIDPIYSILSKLGLSFGFDDPMIFLQQTVPISQYVETNALFTYYINFYMDFSYLGFFLVPFPIGIFTAYCVELSGKESVALKMLAYSNLLHLFNGVMRWEYQAFDIAVSVVMILLLWYMEKQER